MQQVADNEKAIKELIVQNTTKIQNLTTVDKHLEIAVSNQEQKLIDQFLSKNECERASLMFEYMQRPGCEFITEIIKQCGYNVEHLACIAATKNNMVILDYAIESGANCDLYLIKNQTLLEYIISSNKTELISKAFKSSANVSNTLINASKNNNLAVIEKLYALDSNIFKSHNELSVFTGFQILLFTGNSNIISKILEIDSSSIDILSKHGESSFKIALRSANDEIIQKLFPYVDIQKELSTLVECDELELVQKAINSIDIKHEILSELYSYSLAHYKLEMSELFLSKNTLCNQDDDTIIVDAIKHKDIITITQLGSCKPELFTKKYDGYSLLQVAIMQNAPPLLIKKILEIDRACVKILADDKSSAFKIAVQHGNAEIIEILSEYIDFKHEMEQLHSHLNHQLETKMLDDEDISCLIELLQVEEVSLEQYLSHHELMGLELLGPE